MNRLHKYRAWDKHTKVMTYSVNVYSEAKDEDCWWCADVLNENGDTSYCFEKDTGVLMEFTGLKDKNGKEIWEGSVIKGKLTIEEDCYDFKGEVIYRDGRFQIEQADFDLWHYDSLEVIGNIYEDEKLLKQ